MVISDEIYSLYGGTDKVYEKGAYIFEEDNRPGYFFQIIKGIVKVIHYDDKGNEMLLGLFHPGETFGEPPLLANKPYPSHAVAFTKAVICKIPRDNFFRILDDYPDIMKILLLTLANRIIAKSNASKILVFNSAEEKIMHLFSNLKNDERCKVSMIVPYTRQQIANITGLRVETVIRTIIKLSTEKKLKIVNHKVQI